MEQVTRMNLPIVGRVQHGEKQIVDNKTKVKELGYFIAKIRNDNMNFLLNRFNLLLINVYSKHKSLQGNEKTTIFVVFKHLEGG